MLHFGPAMAASLLPFGLVLLLATTTSALRVTPDSSCSSVCGDSTATNASDIVCNDFDYYATSTGSTFMSCLECLQTSNATRDSDNDVSWFLYNLRYASAVCLFDFPSQNASSNATSACDVDHACKPLQGAIESGNLVPSNETEYGYCQADDDAFYGTSINDCVSCLQSSASTYTANFLLALEAGCQQEPETGTLLSITGSLFSTTAINITSASNGTNGTSTTSATASSKPSPATTIAISVSLGTLVFAAMGLFTLYCIRQRRHAREDAHVLNNPYASHQPQQHHGYLYYGKEPSSSSGAPTATSGSAPGGYALQPAPPQYTVDYKPDDYNSNAEYYDRLEGRSRGPPLQAHPIHLGTSTPDSMTATNSAAAALPTHPAYIPRNVTPGALGGRASRAASVSGSASSDQQQQQQQQRRSDQGRKKPSYAMEVYLEGRGDDPIERAPSRNINVQLGRQGAMESQQQQVGHALQAPPRALTERRRKSLSPPPPDRSMSSTPMPKNRSGVKKPPRLQIEESAPLDKNIGISGPLAFPDSRFSVRPPVNDRIVEQTVDRGGRHGGNIIEVPIGSGKSYLYG